MLLFRYPRSLPDSSKSASPFQGAVRKSQRCETTKNRIQKRKNAVFGFISDLKPIARPRGCGRKAQNKKSMLRSHVIGCHGSPQANFRQCAAAAQAQITVAISDKPRNRILRIGSPDFL